MKPMRLISLASTAAALAFSVGSACAQQVPPARRARPTQRRRLTDDTCPHNRQQFGGVINLEATKSKPYWPPQVVPPKGAPNVLLIMTDDQGYGVSGTFGGVIPTPTLDRIAQMGLRYTQFHSTALCSPTRAALITGRNHHSVGFGVISEQSTGYPGLRLRHRRRQRHDRRRSSSRTATPPRGSARTTTRRATSTARRGRSISGRSAWASSTSTASWAARPTSGRRTCSGTRRRFSRGSASPATTSPPIMADDAIAPHAAAQRRRARQAVLRLLRARRHPFAAPADAGVDRQVQGQVRHGLERAARPDLRQPEAARRDPGEHAAHALAGRSAEVGDADAPTRRSCSRARPRSSPPTWPTPTTRSAA